ncbi:MAG TPA: hypothetical protein VGL60_08180 [Acidimicrobiales bacterium]
MFLFGEHIRRGTFDIVGEIASACLLILGVTALSHSPIVGPPALGPEQASEAPPAQCHPN